MTELPSDWAIRRALIETGRPCDQSTVDMVKGYQRDRNTTLLTLARYIEKHETAPDRLTEEARGVVSQMSRYPVADVLDGGYDSSPEMEAARLGIERGMRLGCEAASQ